MVVVEGSPTKMTEKRNLDGWMNSEDAASMLGKAKSALNRYKEAGKLHPELVDGKYLYDPLEVTELLDTLEQDKALARDPKLALEKFQTDTMRSMVNLIKEPREKIDKILFDMIERQSERIKSLEKELDDSRVATELAKDQTAERALSMKMVESEARIKEMAMSRMVSTLGKLIGGPEGVALTPNQLEQLILANNDGEEKFLTADQEKLAKEIVAKEKAKSNGKQTAATVAKTVVDAVGVPT